MGRTPEGRTGGASGPTPGSATEGAVAVFGVSERSCVDGPSPSVLPNTTSRPTGSAPGRGEVGTVPPLLA
ncbi:hypothetical protein Cus16_2299 [Curtobacterium sp. ER1/6]|nr:hypothetical protein Cus16_2299 [Curtobacterium sp. ER1/6]